LPRDGSNDNEPEQVEKKKSISVHFSSRNEVFYEGNKFSTSFGWQEKLANISIVISFEVKVWAMLEFFLMLEGKVGISFVENVNDTKFVSEWHNTWRKNKLSNKQIHGSELEDECMNLESWGNLFELFSFSNSFGWEELERGDADICDVAVRDERQLGFELVTEEFEDISIDNFSCEQRIEFCEGNEVSGDSSSGRNIFAIGTAAWWSWGVRPGKSCDRISSEHNFASESHQTQNGDTSLHRHASETDSGE
jgi:hypothetical protein